MIPLRVLVLEDQPSDAELMLHALRRADFDCDATLVSSEEELARALGSDFDVILSDFSLPGFSALGALDLLHTRGHDVPLIVVTASRDEETAAECFKRGAFDYITKDRLARLPAAVVHVLEQRRRAAQTRATEQRNTILSAAVEHSAAAIVITNREGVIEYVNPQFTAITGYSAEEAISRTPRILKSGVQSPEFYADLWRTIQSGREWRGEFANRKKSGEMYWEQASISPVLDENGAITHFLAVKEDITERRRAEATLREHQARTDFALAAARMGVWELDLTSGRLEWSESLDTVFGLAPEQSPRTTDAFFELIHPDDRPGVREGVERSVRDRRDLINEFRTVRPDGDVRWIGGRARLVFDAAGKATGMIGVAIDITDRKSLEEQFRQAQKMEAVGQLAGGVAHDFNNLLTAILGYANLLAHVIDPADPKREDVEQLTRAAERAASLTQQLLAFSRKQVLHPRLVDVNVVVTNTMQMLRRMIAEHIELHTVLAPALPTTRVDPTQLEQVVMNLAVNARDAMPSGGRLTIETAAVELDESYSFRRGAAQPGRYVLLTVSDTGVGMDAQTKERIFEPFFTTKEQGQGTGLGLATVYGIVKQSGGYIWLYSEPDRGSVFKVYLPVAEGTMETESVTRSARSTTGSETVLLVEDEESVRRLTRVILERAGYTVHEAANPEVAEAVFEKLGGNFDLLITDVVMPGSSGPAMYQRFATRRPGLKVLYMSGYTNDTVAHAGGPGGRVAFLDKPFTADTLTRKVREVLDG